MTITRRGLADEIDMIDDKIAVLQGSKAGIYKSYREQLDDAGKTKADIAAEIVACKAAIRRRQAIAKDQSAVEAKEELSDEIFIEISTAKEAGTRNALTRVARETDEEPPAAARSRRSRARLTESMADVVEQSKELAAVGLISPEAAAETARYADLVATKLGDGPIIERAPEYDLADIPKGLDRRVSP